MLIDNKKMRIIPRISFEYYRQVILYVYVTRVNGTFSKMLKGVKLKLNLTVRDRRILQETLTKINVFFYYAISVSIRIVLQVLS